MWCEFNIGACVQHDYRSAAGAAEDDGDLQQHHAVRAGLQHILQDHRAHPVALRHRALHQAGRQGNIGAPAHRLPLWIGAAHLCLSASFHPWLPRVCQRPTHCNMVHESLERGLSLSGVPQPYHFLLGRRPLWSFSNAPWHGDYTGQRKLSISLPLSTHLTFVTMLLYIWWLLWLTYSEGWHIQRDDSGCIGLHMLVHAPGEEVSGAPHCMPHASSTSAQHVDGTLPVARGKQQASQWIWTPSSSIMSLAGALCGWGVGRGDLHCGWGHAAGVEQPAGNLLWLRHCHAWACLQGAPVDCQSERSFWLHACGLQGG